MKAAAASQQSSTLSVNTAAIINISTGMASIADNTSGGIYAYRCSKVGTLLHYLSIRQRSLTYQLVWHLLLIILLVVSTPTGAQR